MLGGVCGWDKDALEDLFGEVKFTEDQWRTMRDDTELQYLMAGATENDSDLPPLVQDIIEEYMKENLASMARGQGWIQR